MNVWSLYIEVEKSCSKVWKCDFISQYWNSWVTSLIRYLKYVIRSTPF